MSRIPLHNPRIPESAQDYVQQAMNSGHLGGDGPFTRRCEDWLQAQLGTRRALLTHSGSTALEAAALLLDIQPGDEIIMPAWTFPSTANAFVLRGAIPVFVDIRPDTLNLNEQQIEDAITPRTQAIAVVHYAGVASEMDTILAIARKYGLRVIEDAAQGFLARYRNQYLGTIADLGILSFHQTKNSGCGEGGALLANDPELIERAEIIRDKGANRQAWQRGEVAWYEWTHPGLGAAPSELTAAVLFAQLEIAEEEKASRVWAWHEYHRLLKAAKSTLALPAIPRNCEPNGHLFAIRTQSVKQAKRLHSEMANSGIALTPHYLPLHESAAGPGQARWNGTLPVTSEVSQTLLRLPIWPTIAAATLDEIITGIKTLEESDP